jgi:hypothetical protein
MRYQFHESSWPCLTRPSTPFSRRSFKRTHVDARVKPTVVRFKGGPLPHAPAVMPVRVAGIHEFSGTLETLKTWMAGTTPGHDANGHGLADQVPLVSAERQRRKFTAFVRWRQCLTGQQWDTPGDDAKSDGSANRVPLVSATRMHRKSTAISHRRQRLTGQPWVKPAQTVFCNALNSHNSFRVRP